MDNPIMYFYASKILWTFVQPSSLIGVCFLLGLVIRKTRKGLGAAFLVAAGSLYLVCGLTPVSVWLLTPLETRVRPALIDEKTEIAGIIVLGGAISAGKDGLPQLNEASGRMFETLRLAKIYPSAPVIFSGGNGELFSSAVSEASVAEQFFAPLGLVRPRLKLEGTSRNTKENAENTAALLKPRPDQQWILVTSAFHMARAKAQFEAQGFSVLPAPCDYRTDGGRDRWRIYSQPSEGLRRMDLAVKEWVSLLVSWAKGDFPWPSKKKDQHFIRERGPRSGAPA